MKKIHYHNIEQLKTDYCSLFSNISQMQEEWASLRGKTPGLSEFPVKLTDILISEFDQLAEWFDRYKDIKNDIKCQADLKRLFKYKGENQTKIAGFFMEHADALRISTCHYCDAAYINVYTNESGKRNHFDLDHFFPKSECPITALSLYNFVPSCPICNERLKRNNVLGRNKEEYLSHCPTSNKYYFDECVTIRIIPTEAYHNLHFQDHQDKFKVHFNTESKIYQNVIETFQLNERYNFHKFEALRLLDLMRDYPMSNIRMIARLLNRDASAVKEDLFQNEYLDINRRALGKLHRDIIKMYDNQCDNI